MRLNMWVLWKYPTDAATLVATVQISRAFYFPKFLF